MELSLELKNLCSQSYLFKQPIQEYLMFISILVWLSMVKFQMGSMLWIMDVMKPANFLKTMMYSLVVELLQIDSHYILMHTHSITKLDHLDQLKYLPHGLKMKAMDYICFSHQEPISDIHVVLLEKVDKQQKPNSKKQISASLHVGKLCSTSQKCNFLII